MNNLSPPHATPRRTSTPLTPFQRSVLQRKLNLALLGTVAAFVLFVGGVYLIIAHKNMYGLTGVLIGPLFIGLTLYKATKVRTDLRFNAAIIEEVRLGRVWHTTGRGAGHYAVFDGRLYFTLTPQQYKELLPFPGYLYRISYAPETRTLLAAESIIAP